MLFSWHSSGQAFWCPPYMLESKQDHHHHQPPPPSYHPTTTNPAGLAGSNEQEQTVAGILLAGSKPTGLVSLPNRGYCWQRIVVEKPTLITAGDTLAHSRKPATS